MAEHDLAGDADFRLIPTDPPADQVKQITFVPFLSDGRCALMVGSGGMRLPSGEVLDGEDYLIDTVLRVPLETAGFRYQRCHPFAISSTHLYAWIEGAPYTGRRPHATAELACCRRNRRPLCLTPQDGPTWRRSSPPPRGHTSRLTSQPTMPTTCGPWSAHTCEAARRRKARDSAATKSSGAWRAITSARESARAARSSTSAARMGC